MKCSYTGHPFPHRLLIFLTQENWTPTKLLLLHNLVRFSPHRGLSPLTHYLGGLSHPREDYHLSLTTPRGLSSPREDYHLSLATFGDCHPLISPTITLGDYQLRNKVTCRPLLDYFIPYPSCLLP